MSLHIIILAAGSGRRMLSKQPKVMHQVGGRPMLEHVVTTAQALNPTAIHVVHGNGGDQVREALGHLPVNWVKQEQQLGTGHAVQQALPFCDANSRVLVLYGDVPLISTQTLSQLLDEAPHHGIGLIVTQLDNPTGFGRIIRNEVGNIIAIIEHRDANPQQLKINEVNTGIITCPTDFFQHWIPKLDNCNKQHEIYLTDIIAVAVDEGIPVGGILAHSKEDVQGVNDRWQLAQAERYYQQRQARYLTQAGVTLLDPNRLDIRGNINIAQDVTLDINIVLEGDVTIGAHSYIGPNSVIRNAVIGEHVHVHANSIIDGAQIEHHAEVGPFARIRPGSQLGEHSKVGNFVELKKTSLGAHSKASHLSYLGDAIVGDHVNIGAGTITCNYDGVNKWSTTIEDGAFIGSNTSLIAPVKVGKNATIGAGSAISADAPAEQLTLARAKETVIEHWQRPQKKIKADS